MRSRRPLALLGAALLAGLALWGGPARAFPKRPDASAAKAKLTKIKVIVGRSRNALVGSVYSHKAGCVGARRARVFEVTGARRRLLDSGSSVRRGAIGYFRLALGRFKWNQTYRIVTAPRRAAGLRCEGDRQTYRMDCADDAVLDSGRPTINCYPLPEGPAALEGTVTTTYVSDGLTQVFAGAVRLTRIANPGSGNVQTAPGTLNWTESGTSGSNGCAYQGSGQLAIGSEPPDAGAIPAAPVWARLVFELGTLRLGPGVRYHVESNGYHYGDMTMTCRNTPSPGIDRLYPGWFDFAGSLYSKGSEFGPGIHAEAVRDDGTLGGVHSLEGIEGGGNNGSTARVEWNLRPAG